MQLPIEAKAETWIHLNGSAKQNASTIPLNSPLRPFEKALYTPPRGVANVTQKFSIAQTGITTWVMDKAPYYEAAIPILEGNVSDGWDLFTTKHFPRDAVVDLILEISNSSMDAMGHPIHLHGHKFWVLGSGSGSLPGFSANEVPASLLDWENPPYRDTFVLPKGGWAVLRYVTDNPGAWFFHCHIEWHLLSGFGVVLVEGEDEFLGSVSI